MTSNLIAGWSWLRRLRGQDESENFERLPEKFWGSEAQRRLAFEEMTMADIPVALKRRLQEEALQATFHRLEMPLRFLLYATAPGREPGSLDEYQSIVNLWRQGLETEARLLPDNFAGAVRCYEPAMDHAYTIKGRCAPGQQLRITVPAWRLHGQVVVRGEAEPLAVEEAVKA
jgi:hypothetical protein